MTPTAGGCFDVFGWDSIGEVLDVHPKTVQRWEREAPDPPPVYRFRRRVRARSGELRLWFVAVHAPSRAVSR